MDLALAPAAAPDPLPEWFHFGFRLEDSAAVTRLHQRLAEAGVPMKQPLEQHEDITFFRCRDRDGYGIEVYWEPQPD